MKNALIRSTTPFVASLAAAAALLGGTAAWAQTGTATALAVTAAAAVAPVTVDGAWARASVQGQKGSGAFMRLTAKETLRLVHAESPAAGVTEVHEMKMDGDIMRMRAVPALDLPAGKTVELKPGGFHVMMMDLKAPLMKNSSVPMTLVFENAQGVQSKLQVNLPVGTAAPGAAGGAAAKDAAAGHKH
jgi:copper(I)-binding protein